MSIRLKIVFDGGVEKIIIPELDDRGGLIREHIGGITSIKKIDGHLFAYYESKVVYTEMDAQ